MATSKATLWKKGRGKLGVLDPLIGSWQAEADTPMGRVRCTRKFSRILHGKRILLEARWHLPAGVYEEHAVYGPDASGALAFWSFTSDGKQSQGSLTDASDIHPEAVAFVAEMPDGVARMVYWPDGDGGVFWVVGPKTRRAGTPCARHSNIAEPGRQPSELQAATPSLCPPSLAPSCFGAKLRVVQ